MRSGLRFGGGWSSAGAGPTKIHWWSLSGGGSSSVEQRDVFVQPKDETVGGSSPHSEEAFTVEVLLAMANLHGLAALACPASPSAFLGGAGRAQGTG